MVRRLLESGPERQTTVVVDASPEFRLQASAAGVKRLDGLLMTHDHADQAHGIDDIRAFALRQRERIECWMDAATHKTLTRRFGYIFEGEGYYPAIANIHECRLTEPPGRSMAPLAHPGRHVRPGPRRREKYRISLWRHCLFQRCGGNSSSLRSSAGDLDVWIVDALRYTPHPTHAHVDQALEWIQRVRPRRAILTNLHIDLDYLELAGRCRRAWSPPTTA